MLVFLFWEVIAGKNYSSMADMDGKNEESIHFSVRYISETRCPPYNSQNVQRIVEINRTVRRIEEQQKQITWKRMTTRIGRATTTTTTSSSSSSSSSSAASSFKQLHIRTWWETKHRILRRKGSCAIFPQHQKTVFRRGSHAVSQSCKNNTKKHPGHYTPLN